MALTEVSKLRCLELALQMHAFVIKSLKVLVVMLLNAVIVMYSRCNSVHTSFRVFVKMPARNVVSWNTMIFALFQTGLDHEALMLLYEMQKHGFKIGHIAIF